MPSRKRKAKNRGMDVPGQRVDEATGRVAAVPLAPGAAPRDPVRGFLYALGGAALVSTNFVTAKYGLRGFEPETFSAVWTTAGASYALMICLVSGGAKDVIPPRGSLLKIGLLGPLTAAGMLLTWAGLALLDPSFSAFLHRFLPVLILLFGAVFLRERFRRVEILPLGLMIAGGAFSTLGRFELVGLGVLLTLLGCTAAAWQMLLAKLLVKPHRPETVVFFRLAGGAVVLVAWTTARGAWDVSVPLRYWLVTLLGALLGPCLSHVLTFRSYRYWELSRSGMVVAIQPLFVLPMAFVFLGQFPAGKELAGGLVILAGALWLGALQMRFGRKPRRRGPFTRTPDTDFSRRSGDA